MSISSIHQEVAPHRQLAGPLYHQIHQIMRQRILSGVWTSGRSMPNESELAQEYGVSLGTMRKALELLNNEGLIVRRQGRGTFVNQNFESDQISRISRDRTCHEMHLTPLNYQIIPNSFEIGQSSASESEALAISRDSKVVRVSTLGVFDGGTAMLDSYVLAFSVMQNLFPSTQIEEGTIRQLLMELLSKTSRYIDKISPEIATTEVANVLGLGPNRPLLNIIRIAESDNCRPLLLLQRRASLASSLEYVAIRR